MMMPFAFDDPANSGIQEVRKRGYFICQAAFESLLRRQRLAVQNYLQRPGQADESRQARRAAPGGEQADLCFGQAEKGDAVGSGNTIVTGKAQLEAAAERRAVNGCDGWEWKGRDAVHHGLAALDQAADMFHRF